MASGKYLRKPNASKSKTQSYKMPPWVRRKIFALIGASALAIGAVQPIRSTLAVKAEEIPSYQSASIQEYTPDSQLEDIVEPVEDSGFCTIGIANDDAEIIVDGKAYKIDKISFVITSGDTALAYDVYGNILKGHLDAENYREVMQITEEEMSNYNIYQVLSKSDAVNVRSSGEIADGNIISTVPRLDYVLGYSAVTPEYDGEWISTLSINDDNLYEGYIREDLIKEIGTFDAINYRIEQNMEDIENMMKVNTEKDGYIALNLREQPKSGTTPILAEIPYGSFVHVLGETVQSGNKTWTLVNYETPDGTQLEGWVVQDYLSSYVTEQQSGQQNIDGININASGNVTGIDISSIDPEDLRDVLKNGISNKTNSAHGVFDTSQLAGQVNFVYIKLGASSFGQGKFSTIDYNAYKKQVEVCEELGVPYGFYYYSTAVTPKEANIELECIEQRLDELKQQYNMKNNVLGLAVDIELTAKHDRQYRGDIKEQTEAKATLINGIQEHGLSDNVLIYAPGRVMQPNLDQIFDLQYLRSLLSNPEDVALWQCSLMNKNGSVKANLAEDIAYAESQGFSTVVSQLVLDGKVGGKVDINNMNLSHFQDILKQKQTNKAITLSSQSNNRNDDSLEL